MADTVVLGTGGAVSVDNTTPTPTVLVNGTEPAEAADIDLHIGLPFGNGATAGDTHIVGAFNVQNDMYYENLIVDDAATLITNGYRVFVKGTLTMSGTGSIRNDGNAGLADGTLGARTAAAVLGGSADGGAGTAADGDPGGDASTPSLGGAGGAGAVGDGGAGGAGGGVTPPTADEGGVGVLTFLPSAITNRVLGDLTSYVNGGAGGGAGGANGGGNPGGGGGGGGGVVLVAAKTVFGEAGSTGVISASGGAGGDGNADGRGGGGGGGGGVVTLVYHELTGNFAMARVLVTGGAGGAGGGTPGAAGAAGRIYAIPV